MSAVSRASAPPAHPYRPYVLLVVKVAITGGALYWALRRASLGAMTSAVSRLSAGTFATAVALLFVNAVVGALRWRAVLRAYGRSTPPVGFLVHAYIVAIFYNTFVPGNIGGDALRGHVTRAYVSEPADAYVTILIERGLGLAGLLVLAGFGVLLAAPEWMTWGVVLLAGAAAAFLASAFFPQGATWVIARLPERFGAKLPRITIPERTNSFGSAAGLSVLSQLLAVLASHVLVRALAPQVTLVDSLAAVPLAMLSLYIPVSVAGLGVREAAFVVLFARAGVSAADATAASLAFMAALMVCGLFGGLVHLLRPLHPASA
jgi:uncharacterized membrane protein YbhN (UPF0104 family)